MPRSIRQRVARREREKRALKLRLRGATFRQIASEVGYANQGGAHKAVRRALAEVGQSERRDLYTLEMERLNDMLFRVWPTASNSDDPKHVSAINAVLAIMDKMNKLAGLE